MPFIVFAACIVAFYVDEYKRNNNDNNNGPKK